MTTLRWLDANAERWLVALLLASIVALITINVFMRYVMNSSLSWGEELTLWFFVWFVWLAVSHAFHKRAHVRITAFRDLLSDRVARILDLIVDLLILTFLVILTIECLKLINLPFVANQSSVVLGIPIPVLYASAPIGASLSAIRVIQHMIPTLRQLAGSSVAGE